MTLDATPDDFPLVLAPLDERADHVRGSPAGRLIIEYGDYECPYSRQAFHAIEQVERQLGGKMRFAFRHFPLTAIHPHALAAAAAAEAAAVQGRFWDMHELLFHRQKALDDGDLLGYAAQLGLDVAAFDRDRASTAVAAVHWSYRLATCLDRPPRTHHGRRRGHGQPLLARRGSRSDVRYSRATRNTTLPTRVTGATVQAGHSRARTQAGRGSTNTSPRLVRTTG